VVDFEEFVQHKKKCKKEFGRNRQVPGTRRTPRKASKQAIVARLQNQAAMVNESTRSTHHEFTPLPAFVQQTPDEENQKSSLSLTTT
jgi:hypothetical protein